MDKNTIAKAWVLGFFNLVALIILFGFASIIIDEKMIELRTADFVTVKDVVIDDISFESDGHDRKENDHIVYRYKMNRMLHFTYEGQELDVPNTEFYTSSNPNYKVELRKNYTDDYVYSIDPSNPYAVTAVKGASSESITDFVKVIVIVYALVLVLVDLIVVWKWFIKKPKSVNMEQFHQD